MKRLSVFILILLCLLVGSESVRALTVIARDFDQLVTRADTIFKGTVTSKISRWTDEGGTRRIITLVTFQVEETYKGTAAATQTLRFLGGTVGDETMEVPDTPRFATGQKAVLFVVENGKRFCPLVGVAQGRFRVVADKATGRERVLTDDDSPVVNTAEIGQLDQNGVPRLRRYARTATPALTADDFRLRILDKVAALPR